MAIPNIGSCSPTISDCIITGNSGEYKGGIYCSEYSIPTIINCIITGNRAYSYNGQGAGITCWNDCNANIINCVISNNFANDSGGGIFCGNNSTVSVTNCTITGNFAGSDGGAIYAREANVVIQNSILYGNTAEWGKELSFIERTATAPSTGTVLYSNIQGGQADVYVYTNSILNWGLGNIDVDPAFANPLNSDYHLKSQAGWWNSNTNSWVMDANTSRCIDAGNPGCPLGDELNDGNNVRINMGAYGGTIETSRSPANRASLADLTNDQKVDFNDLAAFVQY